MKTKRVTEIIGGEKLFRSTGKSILKVTRNEKEIYLILPTQSLGIFEFQKELERGRPIRSMA